ncbi:hypothetical protein yc1106_09061 [Curvularia clavata]|uniref:DUF3176 domain containing protein n=1 Tax=Curvularia clavata TaxID=95742 RepID=A0A9Q9DWE1_CURCL|nr:hypothetical protein yc1106_09061 [Curvularia clavata]
MARPERSPMHWPSFPDVPIYLDTSNSHAANKTYGTTPTTPTTPERVPSGRPTHLSPAHINAPPISPVEPSPTTTIETSSDHNSQIWPIPEPPPEVRHQKPRRPYLQFIPNDRPRLRLGESHLTVPQQAPVPESQYPQDHKSHHGLGISGGPPKPPSITVQPPPFDSEKVEPATNIAQRIEEKLWNYNSSGNVIERWILEIVSWLISAICMAAIIAVLAVLKDKPAAKWPFDKMGLTLNAFVSVLSRIAGAALLLPVAEALGQLKWSWFVRGDSKKMWDFEMFDNASRGPWGAFLLLIHTRGKTIAALGALVTIFALALDPFFQQVVSFPERWTLQEANSSIPRTVRYQPVYDIEYVNGIDMAETDADIWAIADQFFLHNGTQPVPYGNGTRADIPISCPSTNCTWPSYETLGMCSQCVETPNLLNFTCMETQVDWTSTLTANVSTFPNTTVCGYFLNSTSDAPVLMSGYIVEENGNKTGEALMMRTLPLVTNPERYALWGDGSINFKHIRNPIIDFVIAASANSADVYAEKMPVVHECVVSWCVKTLESSYHLGTYEEKITNVFLNETPGSFPWSSTQSEDENILIVDYFDNVTISAPPVNPDSAKYGWGVNNDTMFNTVYVFDRIFPAFTTLTNYSETPVLRWRTGSFTQARTKYLDYNPWLPPNNISRHMERMTEALTNVVRSSTSKEMVFGQAFDNEVYVEVKWGWLSLPLCLLLVSCLFLVSTVIKSAAEKGQVSIRKNSAIATLLYGLPDHYQKRLAKSNSEGTPRARAKELKVRLSATRGWRSSGMLFTPSTPKGPSNLPPPGWI